MSVVLCTNTKRNETETKLDGTKRNETKRDETKRNETKRNETAELGFVVVSIDGRGTPGRSKSFHDAYYGMAYIFMIFIY